MKSASLWRAIAAVTALTAGLVLAVPAALPSAIPKAAAADLSGFQPGNIISDEIFFNPGAMSASQIQAFLDSKVARCQSGYTCLRDYHQDTYSRAGDPMCSPYSGAASESAAQIIFKVGVACGINPQVLLVTLQKEWGLVTRTAPSDAAYRTAMGYGCPDTAPCDAEFFGFYNQVYKAAWAFKRYTMPPGTGPGTEYTSIYSRYAPGKYADVLYNPDTSCGSSRVYIQNYATASLYFYTPYQPNAASLAAGYGSSSDYCSSYGNRNFYNYFTDWFGSTTTPVSSAILWKYGYSGGPTGILGEQIGVAACGLQNDGCWQGYANGAIYASRDNPPRYILSGEIRTLWSTLGYEQSVASSLGYPVTDTNTGLRDGGSWQGFQKGAIYTSPSTGAFVIKNGPVRDEWTRLGWEHPIAGALGYPLNSTDTNLRNGGAWQQFQNGAIYYSPTTGARVIEFGPIRDYWISQGYEGGSLGYPTSAIVKNAGTAWQTFEGGVVYQGTAGEITVIPQPFGDMFFQMGGGRALGAPLGPPTCGLVNSGCAQLFEQGTLIYSASSTVQAVTGATLDAWRRVGSESGALGYPTGTIRTGLRDRGTWQPFAGGAIYASASLGAHVVFNGPIRTAWTAQGYEYGPLGYPTADPVVVSSSYTYQTFENGTIVQTGNRTQIVANSIAPAYIAAGGADGILGSPTGAADTRLKNSGSWQPFQNGAIYSSPATGSHILLNGSVRQFWTAQDYEKGALGYPITDLATGLRGGGSWQGFEGGAVYAGPRGTYSVPNGTIRDLWSQLGAETDSASALGYPVGRMDQQLRDKGSWQGYEKGAIYSSTKAGTHVLANGPIRDLWTAQDYEKGPLGYPTTDLTTGLRNGGSWQGFEGGAVYSSDRGAFAVFTGSVASKWAQLGYESDAAGAMGYPVTKMDRSLRNGGSWQGFEKGAIYSSPAGGTHVLENGPIRDYWAAQDYEKGPLGYPTTDSYPANGGVEQMFERGTLHLDTTTGVVTKLG
jgi:uncharacterized protein with LGFP repeats